MNEEWERTAKATELAWWERELYKMGLEAFRESRKAYFSDMISGFNDKFKPEGVVVNIGMGLMSIFNFINTAGIEVDSLADQYREIIPDNSAVSFLPTTERFGDGYADTIICFNTLDHTSEPEKMVLEIHRILKEGGTLYFEVNFDRYESPAHYQHFSKELVHKMFIKGFKIILENFKENCGLLKNWDEYYAIMRKI